MAAVEKALDRRAAEKPKGGGLFGSLKRILKGKKHEEDKPDEKAV